MICTPNEEVTPAAATPLVVTVDGALRILAMSRTMLHNEVKAGRVRPLKYGRAVRFSMAELERFVAERVAESA